jgi:conjugal transfer pilus assembly protein TraB
MSQFIKDFGLKLKRDRKTQVLTGLAVVCLGFLMFSDGGAGVRRAPKPKPPVQVGANDPDERWKDLVERFNKQLNDLTHTTNSLQEQVSGQEKAMKEYEATTAEIFKKILERLAEVQNTSSSQTVVNNGPQDLGDVSNPDVITTSPDELEGIGSVEPVAIQPPPQPAKPRLAAVMPGDSVRVKLLAGVNAPTDGTPYPVVLKLIGDVIGPDGNSIPLGEARIIAAATGSLTDSRALLRLTKLSIRLPNGRRKEFTIDGWVVGEDGIRGMEGVLIDPIGKAIGGAAMAGGLGAAGAGLAAAARQNYTYSNGTQSSTIDAGKIPQYAAGMGVAGAATEWTQIIKDRLSQLVPVVQVLSGREATAVFSQSLAIPDLLEQVDDDPSVVYASLD